MNTPHTPTPDTPDSSHTPGSPHTPDSTGGAQIPPAQHSAPQAAPQAAQPSAQPTAPQPQPPRSQPAGPARPLRLSKGGRTGLRTTVAIVGALALLIPTAGLASTGYSLATLSHDTSTAQLPADAQALTIEVGNASVEVTVTESVDQPAVTFERTGHRVRAAATQVEEADGTVRVTVPDQKHSGPRWLPDVGREDRLRVDLPAAYAEDLDLDVTSRWGFTEVTGAFATAHIESEGGAIHLDVDAQDVSAQTSTGLIDVTGTMDTLRMVSSQGYLGTWDANVARSLVAQTATGAVSLQLGSDAVPAEGVEALTETGSIDIGLPRESFITAEDFQGYAVDARTQTGNTDIRVRPAAADAHAIPIRASAQTGTVTVAYLDASGDWVDSDADDPDDADDAGDADRDDEEWDSPDWNDSDGA